MNEALVTVSRSQHIHQSLVHAILEQRLLPGTKLGEDELGHIYGASRTIVREALQALAHEGIIVMEKNRGAFVAQPTPQDAQQVFDARRLIESRIAEIAASRPVPWREAFEAHMAAERVAEAQGDERATIRLSGEFHLLIADQAGHLVYRNFLHKLVARSSLIILLYRNRAAKPCGVAHHAGIAEAIAGGDARLAARLMVEHLREIEAGLDLLEDPPAPTRLADVLTPMRPYRE